MLRLTMTALLATALVPGFAVAQSSGSASSGETKATTSAQQNQSIPQELKKQLTEQGFTDVEIIPGSFLIAAKNKDGDPVRMVVDPHSVTMLTLDRPDQSSTTGSGMDANEKESGESK